MRTASEQTLPNLLSTKSAFRGLLFIGLVLVALIINILCITNNIKWIDRPFAGFMINQRIIFTNVGQSQWTGIRAGLRYPDKILKANDKPISSLKDLQDIINKSGVGEQIRYSLDRAGQVIEVTIPTMRFTWLDFILTFGIPFLSGFIYIVIGVVVFILKPDTEVSWAHLLLCLFLGVYTPTGVEDSLPTQINLFFHAFLPGAFIHLSLVFPEKWKWIERHSSLQYIPYLFSASLALPMLIIYPGSAFVPIYQLGYLYLIIGTFTLVASTLRSYFKGSSIIARQRSKVILLGAALAFPIPALDIYVGLFASYLVKMTPQHNLVSITLLLFPASIAFAIARHNLFDVDVYIKRAVGYVLMTIIVAMGYFSIQTFVSTIVLTPIMGENAEKAYPIVFALLVVFLFNPVNRRVQDGVDKMFFRKKFDYKKTVDAVGNALTSLLNLDEIIRQVIHTVRKEMFIDTAGVVILDPKKKTSQSFFVGDESVHLNNRTTGISIGNDDPLLALLSKEKKLVTKFDIAENPHYAHLRESCGRRFSEMGASVAIPLIYQDEVRGMLALGNKKSGHFYTREDIDLLTTLANQGAVAIENAKMAEQMKKEEMVRTNLARYLSPQIVDQIIQKDVKVNLGGDRKVVTVLFSDIRNFTTITETRPPDQLVQILNEYFTEMAGIIFENQGSLDKYIGDAIVAVFGSLIPLENSAAHAVTASIQMMKQLPALNERWMNEYGFTMSIGIGINTGEVFLGNIGSPERMEFTVIGDAVNVASRFSGLAKAGQILMTRETFACLGPDIKYKELPPSEVKGKTGKLEVFEVLSE